MNFANIKNTRYLQYVAAMAASLSIAANGVVTAWSSPTLPKLFSKDSPIGVTVTADEASWIVALYTMGGIVSTFFCTPMMHKLGPKRTLLISVISMVLPWILIIFAKSVLVLYFGRFMFGLTVAPATTACTVYNSEIPEKEIRGKIGTYFTIMKLLGHFVVLAVGPFVSYTVLGIICTMIPIICVCLFYFMPESPYYLIKIGDKQKAKENIIRLSGGDVKENFIEKRIEDIELNVEKDMMNKTTTWELFSNKRYRKPLFVMFGIKTIQQMSGYLAIESYLQTIIASTGSSISPEISSIIFGAVQFPAVFAAAFAIDKFGRKPLFIVSAIGCAVSLIAEGIYFYIQDGIFGDVSSISWLPTTGIVLFVLMNPLGITSIAYVLMGEIFPVNVKEAAITVMTFQSLVLAFIVSKFFHPLSEMWGMYTIFWIFGGFCIFGALFAFLFLPETKGKSFTDIQNKLRKENKDVKLEVSEIN